MRVETEAGLGWTDPLQGIAAVAAALSDGDACPRCGIRCSLFYGDPDGEYWCAACQFAAELGLERLA